MFIMWTVGPDYAFYQRIFFQKHFQFLPELIQAVHLMVYS